MFRFRSLFYICFAITFLLSISSASGFAETKTFIKEYTYQASEDDSRNSSRVIALREVKRLLLEELGTYLESETEVKNFQLTKDQITTLTAGIVQTEIVAEKWDGRLYWLKSKITADPDKVVQSINELRKDRDKTKELEAMRQKSDELLREVERLRKVMASAKNDKRVAQQKRLTTNRSTNCPPRSGLKRGMLFPDRMIISRVPSLPTAKPSNWTRLISRHIISGHESAKKTRRCRISTKY